MTGEMWFVIAVLIAVFAAIVTEKLRAELAALTGCCVLLAARVLSARPFPPSSSALRNYLKRHSEPICETKA